jgi:anaerobic selenocysteine-containing dehydrogenase
VLGAEVAMQRVRPPRPQFLNSTFANSPRHRAGAGDPTIEMADADARSRGLADGQWAEVFNARGDVRARVSLSKGVRPGVAV